MESLGFLCAGFLVKILRENPSEVFEESLGGISEEIPFFEFQVELLIKLLKELGNSLIAGEILIKISGSIPRVILDNPRDSLEMFL